MKPNPPHPPLALEQLSRLKELFAMLNAGRHVNRLAEPVLWAELEREATQYERVFGALGYELRIDGRGYAWFQTSEASGRCRRARASWRCCSCSFSSSRPTPASTSGASSTGASTAPS